MRGIRHTGCLAGFAQIHAYTSQCHAKLWTTWYSSPDNQSNITENRVSRYSCHSIFEAFYDLQSNPPYIFIPDGWFLNLPVWRPFLTASNRVFTRFLECTTAGFFIMRPSFCRRATLRRELAREISLTSLGSNQILRLPHLRTDAARRFWSLRDTVELLLLWWGEKRRYSWEIFA
jgi:hypothetical protein